MAVVQEASDIPSVSLQESTEVKRALRKVRRLRGTPGGGLITEEGIKRGLPIFTQEQDIIREAFRGF